MDTLKETDALWLVERLTDTDCEIEKLIEIDSKSLSLVGKVFDVDVLADWLALVEADSDADVLAD